MIAVLQLLALAALVLFAAQFAFGFGLFKGRPLGRAPQEGPAREAPAQRTAARMRALSEEQAALRRRYPVLFEMLGEGLDPESVDRAGSRAKALDIMVEAWAPRRREVEAEIIRLLGENPREEETRAVVISACDAPFEEKSSRDWLIGLLGRFNAL